MHRRTTMWPFGFSLQELLGLGMVLTVAGGYRAQFLRASKRGGLFVGRAVGFIRKQRDQVFSSTAQKRELDSLHQQLSEAMSELQHIRHDIRSSARPFSSDCSSQQPFVAQNNAPTAAAMMGEAIATASPVHSTSLSTTAAQSVTFDAADPLHAAGPSELKAESTLHLKEGVYSPAERFKALQTVSVGGKTVYIGGVPLVPVSAADVRTKANVGGATCGSQIVSEALEEQEVADQVTSVLRSSTPRG